MWPERDVPASAFFFFSLTISLAVDWKGILFGGRGNSFLNSWTCKLTHHNVRFLIINLSHWRRHIQLDSSSLQLWTFQIIIFFWTFWSLSLSLSSSPQTHVNHSSHLLTSLVISHTTNILKKAKKNLLRLKCCEICCGKKAN